MNEPIFRKKSLERISSPEALNDYLHVTTPAVWLVMTAVILLLAGILVWGSAVRINSYASGTAVVQEGSMTIHFDNDQLAGKVESGMTVLAGDSQSSVSAVGTDAGGSVFALAPTTLADGNYPVRIIFRRTQILSLLFE